uniref:Uncharacterized protein n=1 Tax=Cucumis sativus TaxID=3659 RepID=A0A0A0K8V7_CUCSA
MTSSSSLSLCLFFPFPSSSSSSLRFINISNPFFSPSPNFPLFVSSRRRSSLNTSLWIRGHIRGDTDGDSSVPQKNNTMRMFGFGSNDETGTQIPTQAQSIVEGSGSVMVSEFKPVPDVDYLQKRKTLKFYPDWLIVIKLKEGLEEPKGYRHGSGTRHTI